MAKGIFPHYHCSIIFIDIHISLNQDMPSMRFRNFHWLFLIRFKNWVRPNRRLNSWRRLMLGRILNVFTSRNISELVEVRCETDVAFNDLDQLLSMETTVVWPTLSVIFPELKPLTLKSLIFSVWHLVDTLAGFVSGPKVHSVSWMNFTEPGKLNQSISVVTICHNLRWQIPICHDFWKVMKFKAFFDHECKSSFILYLFF